MPNFICYIDGRPIVQGFKRYEFLWDEALQCYVFEGKTFTEQEFNDKTRKVFSNLTYRALFPMVKCLDAAAAPVAIPPISTITAGEVTLEQALEVVDRLAPDRLKRKPGPRIPQQKTA